MFADLWVSERFFQGGPKVVKFHFTHSELKKITFFDENLIEKFQISK